MTTHTHTHTHTHTYTQCHRQKQNRKIRNHNSLICEIWNTVALLFDYCLTVFFQLLTSFCPICSHIFKTLNPISTTSVCCDHTISTVCVVFTQYAVNYHISKLLTFSFHSSLRKTKIMDLFSHIYKCLNTACQNWRPNVPNLKYSIKLLPLLQQQLKRIEKSSLYKLL